MIRPQPPTHSVTAASNLRRKLSQKVLHLRNLENYVDQLLENGVDQQLINQYLQSDLIKNPNPPPFSKVQISNDIKQLFDLGGVISGGAALSMVKERPIKDIDFYFNDEISFVQAYLLTFNNPCIDICWYFDKPHELHDMSYVMCNVYSNGKIEITPQAQKAFDTGISELYIDNFIWPERSARRMIKYHKRYGVKFKKKQVLSMIGLFQFDNNLSNELMLLTI